MVNQVVHKSHSNLFPKVPHVLMCFLCPRPQRHGSSSVPTKWQKNNGSRNETERKEMKPPKIVNVVPCHSLRHKNNKKIKLLHRKQSLYLTS